MTSVASPLSCRLLAASGCAYGIIPPGGEFTIRQPYYDAVGWTAEPAAFSAGPGNIDACLVGANQDGVILAFRGTIPPDFDSLPSLLDWCQDIFFAQPVVRAPLPGTVNLGFWNALDSLWAQILPAVQKLLEANPQAKLYITGHSKGGAMSALAAARLFFSKEGAVPAAVQTFAAARAGNVDFVNAFPLGTIPVTRYENHEDIVPFLPPAIETARLAADFPPLAERIRLLNADAWDYRPLGTLQFIRADGTIVGDSPGLEVRRFLRILELLLTGQFEAVGAAHCASCANPPECQGGYMRGVCPEVCSGEGD